MSVERVYEIIKFPIISEKATALTELSNHFVFAVCKTATKNDVRAAIEKLFKVNVESVNIAVIKGKTKQNKYGKVNKSDLKKAYVRVASGQVIDFTSL